MKVTFIKDYLSIPVGTTIEADAGVVLSLFREGYVTIDDTGLSVMLKNPAGNVESLQIGTLGAVAGLTIADFTLAANAPFLIKNDGTADVVLTVKMINGATWVTTNFSVGWNAEIVQAIQMNADVTLNLKYGY